MVERIIFLIIRLVTFDYYIIKKVLKKYKGSPKSILDLGCGNGYLSPFFTQKSYLGVEIDEHLVLKARKDYPNHTFIVGDITNLKLEKKFDLILIIGVLHHLSAKNFKKGLKTIDKLLKKSGKVLIVEAIPPLSKLNVFGRLMRQFDRGDFIRRIPAYEEKMRNDFKIELSKPINGGIVDYALFILSKK